MNGFKLYLEFRANGGDLGLQLLNGTRHGGIYTGPVYLEVVETTPIENILQEETLQFSSSYLAAMSLLRAKREEKGLDLVGIHKTILGRQTRTFTGEFRHWVWETPKWTVYVSNFKGVSFEVPEDATLKTAWAAWWAYRKAMGV